MLKYTFLEYFNFQKSSQKSQETSIKIHRISHRKTRFFGAKCLTFLASNLTQNNSKKLFIKLTKNKSGFSHLANKKTTQKFLPLYNTYIICCLWFCWWDKESASPPIFLFRVRSRLSFYLFPSMLSYQNWPMRKQLNWKLGEQNFCLLPFDILHTLMFFLLLD